MMMINGDGDKHVFLKPELMTYWVLQVVPRSVLVPASPAQNTSLFVQLS